MPLILMVNQFREIRKLPAQRIAPRNPNQSTLKVLRQTGRSNITVDRGRPALLPGKRVSMSGNVYWETRKNRSDNPGSRV